jgi:Flp pilus assembly protein TadG
MIGNFSCLALLRKLRRDERGSILVQFTIIVVVMMGMIGLALDGGRFIMLNSDLQDLADAAALAGAAKLDGTLGARTRADTAARSLGNANNVNWWDVSAPKILAGTAGVQFYATLADLDANNPASTDQQAKVIKVTTGSWQVAPTFLRPVGATSNNSTKATAAAKYDTDVCVPQGMMLCNPNEPATGGTGDPSATFNPTPGQEFRFSQTPKTGTNNDYSPGDFDLLKVPMPDGTLSGGNSDIQVYLSKQFGDSCVAGGMSPAAGQKTAATINGINVRFDENPNGSTAGMDLTSAPVKTDGYIHPTTGRRLQCNQSTNPAPTSSPLPEDTPLNMVGNTSIGAGPSASSLTNYWSNHHSAAFPGSTTRYDLYKSELNATWTPTSETAEPHAPQCLATSTVGADRRIMKVAVIDCKYWGIKGTSVGNIPQKVYADFFLIRRTDPGGSGGIIYTEYVRKHTITGDGPNPIVQLVR